MFNKYIKDLPPNIKGGLWMVLAGLFFTFLGVMIRMANNEVHILEIVFFRYLFSLLIMVPWVLRLGVGGLKAKNISLLFTRSISSYIAAILWFASMIYLPLAEATALGYTTPLFVTLGAVLFLNEIVGKQRWFALGIGFIGILVILRPGSATFAMPALLAIGGAIFIACSALLVKILNKTDTPDIIVLYMAIFSTPISLIAALFVWKTPSYEALAWLFGIGLFSTFGHLAYTRSFAAANASVVLPYDYMRLLMVAAVGYGFFKEIPDIWTWVGGCIIIISTFYISRRDVIKFGTTDQKNKLQSIKVST